MKPSIVFITTIPLSLNFFKGQLNYLKSDFNVVAVSSPGPLLKEIGQREGIQTYSISMKREISLFKDLLGLIRFLFLFIRLKPTIVHGNTPKGSLLSLGAAFLTRVPVRIYMCHGLRYQSTSGFKRRLLIFMEKITCFCATSVLCVSAGVNDTLQRDAICKNKSKVILNGSSNGIDTDLFIPLTPKEKISIKKQYNIPTDTFIFSFVGRIIADKGINELVNAFCKLSLKYPNMQLHLIGDFDTGLNPVSKETRLQIDSNQNIILFGSQKDVRPFMGISDVLVLPSYREGFGLVLMEAGAMGIPVLATNIIGCNNVVQSDNGLLVNSRDEEHLLNGMFEIYNNTVLRSRFQQKTRASIKARFEQRRVWNAYKNEYISYVQ